MELASERRTSPRFPAVRNQTRLEWIDGLESRTATARLINVSEGGALLSANLRLTEEEIVWLRLEQPARTDWISARVVRHHDGDHAAIAFLEPCPYDFLQSATLGIGLENLL